MSKKTPLYVTLRILEGDDCVQVDWKELSNSIGLAKKKQSESDVNDFERLAKKFGEGAARFIRGKEGI